jgi:cystathionine beta-lyase/cystathionine gamma-synthase
MISLGGSMDPDPAYLLIRGLKTLEIRVRRQCQSAMAVARFLEHHPKVERVHYPGLASHPDHRLAQRQMTGFGGMLAFDMKGGLPAARRFCDKARIFLLAVSLGGVESLIVLPIYTSHHRMSEMELAAAGVKPGTIRMSIGLEAEADLIADLKSALS